MDQQYNQEFFEALLSHYYLVNGKAEYDNLMLMVKTNPDKAFDILEEFTQKYQKSILVDIISNAAVIDD